MMITIITTIIIIILYAVIIIIIYAVVITMIVIIIIIIIIVVIIVIIIITIILIIISINKYFYLGEKVSQGKVRNRGKEYTKSEFPKLDYITSCDLIEENIPWKYVH